MAAATSSSGAGDWVQLSCTLTCPLTRSMHSQNTLILSPHIQPFMVGKQ